MNSSTPSTECEEGERNKACTVQSRLDATRRGREFTPFKLRASNPKCCTRIGRGQTKPGRRLLRRGGGILDKNRQGRGTELEFATPSPFKFRKGTFKIPSLNELTIVTLIRHNMFHEFLTNYPIMIEKRMDIKYTFRTN